MALIFVDGMEDIASWAQAGATSLVAGRNGNCAKGTATSTTLTYQVPTAQEADTFTVGFALKITNLTAGVLFSFRSDAGVTQHTALSLNTDGSLDVLRGTSSALLTTIPGLIAAGQWYYVELQAKLHDTTGTAVLRINGVTVATGSALDTKNAGTKTGYDAIRFSRITGNDNYVDDVYLMSGSGDSFLGDCAVETLYPDGDGNANAWLGSDGNSVANWQLVDEVGAPSTADYVGDSTVGHQDLYTLTALVRSSGSLFGVCHAAHCARSDAVTPRSVKLVNRRTGDTKSADFVLGTTYASIHYALALDPDAGPGAWTIANVNALQSGIEMTV